MTNDTNDKKQINSRWFFKLLYIFLGILADAIPIMIGLLICKYVFGITLYKC